MGPALLDDQWRYGSSMAEIVETILQGRPNGMPSFRGKITEQQAWQLAAYVRSLSAQPRQDALPGRADETSATEPLTLRSREPTNKVDLAGH
jgi:cytochrome c oxidase cbb3-type subunit 3